MSSSDLPESLRALNARLLSHADRLRNRFSDIEQEFQEGNLDGSSLNELSRAIHQIEIDAGDFERLLETP